MSAAPGLRLEDLPATLPLARYWRQVDKTGDCWLWTGKKSISGYGVFTHLQKNYRVHRIAWVLTGQVIPDGLVMDHLCRVRNCVNPAHLEPVTSQENTLRGLSPTTVRRLNDHCPVGHPYAGSNLLILQKRGAPSRRCRTCRTLARHRHRAQMATCDVCGIETKRYYLAEHQWRRHPKPLDDAA